MLALTLDIVVVRKRNPLPLWLSNLIVWTLSGNNPTFFPFSYLQISLEGIDAVLPFTTEQYGPVAASCGIVAKSIHAGIIDNGECTKSQCRF